MMKKKTGPKDPTLGCPLRGLNRLSPFAKVCWRVEALKNIKSQAPNYKQISNSNIK
jgi:hypothetical protein